MKQITGYVATLDILGFADLLYRERYSQILREYIDCIDEVVRPADVECVLFSDSVVLTAPGDSEDAFSSIIRACSAAFHGLILREIPVRGAVAFGSYWREARSGSVFLAGRPIIEAYTRERGQKWVGTLLCPSILRKQTGLKDLTTIADKDTILGELLSEGSFEQPSLNLTMRLQPAKVPFQDSAGQGDLSGYGVVPLDSSDQHLGSAARSIRHVLDRLEDLQMKAAQPHAQGKYQSTLLWLQEIRQRFSTGAKDIRVAKKEAGEFQNAES